MNDFYYVDGDGTTHVLWRGGDNRERAVLAGSEAGEGMLGEPYIEKTPNLLSNNYRDWLFDTREYGFEIKAHAANPRDLETIIGNWNDWHDPLLGEGYIKRLTRGGRVRCLSCIPNAPEWTFDDPLHATCKQGYTAACPWWHSEDATTVNSAFNGAVPVAVACTNNGDIPAWPVITITGIVNTPVMTNSDGKLITVNESMANADDVMVIDCRPWGDTRRYIYYQVHGAGAEVPCRTSSDTTFIRIPKGTNNLDIVATAGTPTISIVYFHYYRGLY